MKCCCHLRNPQKPFEDILCCTSPICKKWVLSSINFTPEWDAIWTSYRKGLFKQGRQRLSRYIAKAIFNLGK